MKLFKQKVEVRWSDLDANMHLANQSYMSFTSFARVRALNELGVTMWNLKKWQRGPIIFEERFNFFREIMPDSSIYIHTRVTGVSEDLSLFEFQHDLYDEKGEHKAHSQIFGCWMDMKHRKMAKDFPEDFQKILEQFKTDDVRILSKSDLKKLASQPNNINPEDL